MTKQIYEVQMSVNNTSGKIHIRVPDSINFPIFTRNYEWIEFDKAKEVFKVLVEFQIALQEMEE
jgi:uncharacterized protein Usg